MAIRKTSNSTREAKKLVCCRDCFWANLIQYENNPVLAECRKKPDFYNPNFPYERDVASTLKYCSNHERQEGKTIQHRVKVA